MSRRRLVSIIVAIAASSAPVLVNVFHAESPRRPVTLSASNPSPSPSSESEFPVEPVHTNYPLPVSSERGNQCPADDVPEGSSTSFDPESGRIEIDFYDIGWNRSRTFVLDVRDPKCFDTQATRHALFIELAGQLQTQTTEQGWADACARLRDAIRAGSLKLGEIPFDLTPAQPYVGEVCRR